VTTTSDTAFDRAIAGVARDGGMVHDLTIDGGWTIGDKPNGGYLLAAMARAAIVSGSTVEGLVHDHPVTASAHYLSAPATGPAEVHAEVLRRGRRMTQVRARLVQDGTARVEATFTLGRLAPDAEPWWSDAPAPEMTPEDACPRAPTINPSGMVLPIMERVELRLDAAVSGFTRGQPSGRGEVRGWVRFADGRPPDPLALLFAADALPPATLDLGVIGWVPTLELTVYVRAAPAPGPLVVRHRAHLVEEGLFDEACDVWDSRGRLVAQATQLAAVRLGDTSPPHSVR
jgi:acyl-Coa thioesterase superfamily protein/acyl-CoA thioesterase superfamily protein